MLGIGVFCAGVVASLAASWLLVTRLERLGERAGFSEAWLGLVAALAADAPEITSAATALSRGQASVGAGVVLGSNVFNLAALLGLAAVVAGWIGFHRRVVVLAGIPAVWIAAVCLLTVGAVVGPAAGLALTMVVLVPYVAVLGMRRTRMERLRLPGRWVRWLVAAAHEEEAELLAAIRPRRGGWRDVIAAVAALIVVIGASTVMEVAATTLGRRYAVADIITGGLVLAVVTSLPNAVSAVYLARRGRGAAVLHGAEQQRDQRRGRAADPGVPRRARAEFRTGHAGSRVVRGPDRARARPGVPRTRRPRAAPSRTWPACPATPGSASSSGTGQLLAITSDTRLKAADDVLVLAPPDLRGNLTTIFEERAAK